VAVLGSVLVSGYGAAIQPALRGAPPQLAQAASDSIGVAATIAARLGPQGQGLLEAARSAVIQGMGDALGVGAGVARWRPCWCCCSSRRPHADRR
jgi:hypothetical protein